MAERETTDWTNVEEVRRQIDAAAAMVERKAGREFAEYIYGYVRPQMTKQLESPLEAIFRVWWEAYMNNCSEYSHGSRLRLNCQHELMCGDQAYRLDFVVGLAHEKEAVRFKSVGCPFPLTAIEVDGHAFHEKTKEQVALRNQRDRALQQAGWIIFHFSWTELTTNGEKCVGEVLDHAIAALFTCEAADGQAWCRDHPEEVSRIQETMAANKAKLQP
jgi:hypothetical protein